MTVSPPRNISLLDRLQLVLATGFGTGYFPKAPGTAGSLLGPLLAWLCAFDMQHQVSTIVIGVVLFLLGIPICATAMRLFDLHDPQQVVYDEIVAFAWVFLFVPLTPLTAVLGFLLFRAFDIVKPWPIRRLEWLPGGLGVMSDDALAGLLAGLVLGSGYWWLA